MLATAMLVCLLTGADPKPTEPAPPRLVTLSVVDGKAAVEVWSPKKEKMTYIEPVEQPGGKIAKVEKEVEVTVMQRVSTPLSKVKELTITTVGGKKLTVEEAEKRIADGAVVIVSADGKMVDAKFLKLFKNNVLILISPDFLHHGLET